MARKKSTFQRTTRKATDELVKNDLRLIPEAANETS